MLPEFQVDVLDNGLTVLSEWVPGVRSVSCGIWVQAGSRLENRQIQGTAHFLEHMVFKGTAHRSAFKIAHELEESGGSLNAYTTKEYTVFYAHTLDTRLTKTISVLSDLVSNPLFREQDLDNEIRVVQEEIKATKDTPEDDLFDIFQENLFPDQGLGYPILGTSESVQHFSRASVKSFWETYYTPENMILSVAGNVNHNKLVSLAKRYFTSERSGNFTKYIKPKADLKKNIDISDTVNQCHLCTGTIAVPYVSERRMALLALNNYLGSGMSSRLFQQIREKYGLVYSIYSYVDFFKDTGIFSVYLGTDIKNKDKALDLLRQELQKIIKYPLKTAVVKQIKNSLKGQILLGLESTNRRMSRLAKNQIYFERQIDINQISAEIDSLTDKILLETAQKIFNIDQFNTVAILPNA